MTGNATHNGHSGTRQSSCRDGRRRWAAVFLSLTPLFCGCPSYRDDLQYDYPVAEVWLETPLGLELTRFDGVHHSPVLAEAVHLFFTDNSVVSTRNVLDLFCGTGLISLWCARENANRVLAVAESPVAQACAAYNIAVANHDSTTTVRDLDLDKSPVIPASSQYECIFATLWWANTQDPADPLRPAASLERRIEILLEAANLNRTASGRVFAFCENGQVRELLETRAASAGWDVADTKVDSPAAPVVELKKTSPATPAPAISPSSGSTPAGQPDNSG